MGHALPYDLCLCLESVQFEILNFDWICFQSFATRTLLGFWVIALMAGDKMILLLAESSLYMNMFLMGITVLISQVSGTI